MTSDPNSKKTTLGVHYGSAVKSMAAKYRGIRQCIPEAVQNALDANAEDIWVTINHKTRVITIRDNGDGVSIDEFNAATGQKGKTFKQDENSVGQFNEGFLSPLGKCDKFTFTSKSKEDGSSQPFMSWTFVTKTIFESDKEVDITPVPISYKYSTKPPRKANNSENWVNWRSEVKIFKFSTTVALDAEEIMLDCTRQFREKMLQIGTTLHLVVIQKSDKPVLKKNYKAQKFAGKKLKSWKKVDGESETHIDLYQSPSTDKSNPGVRVSALKRPYDLPISTLLNQETCRAVLHQDKDLVSALKSNIFQGKIESNLLVLKSTRADGFEETESLLEFLEHLECWWNEVGRTEFAKLQNNESLEIFYACAKKAQDEFKKLTDDPELQKLLESLNRSKSTDSDPGLIAEADKNGNDIVFTGKEGTHKVPEPTTREKNVTPGKPGGKSWANPVGGNKPITVSYKGLKIKESQDLGSSVPWQLELANLTVLINIEHQYYSRCFDAPSSKKEKVITDYQKKVLFQALSLITSGSSPSESDWHAAQQVLFQELFLEVLNIAGSGR